MAFCILTLNLISPYAVAVPLYKIEKDGQTNWILSASGAMAPEADFKSGLLPTLQKVRLILMEGHLEYEEVRSIEPVRKISTDLGLVDWLRFSPLLKSQGFTEEELNRMSGFLLAKSLHEMFTQLETEKLIARLHSSEAGSGSLFMSIERKLRRFVINEGLLMSDPEHEGLKPIEERIEEWADDSKVEIENLNSSSFYYEISRMPFPKEDFRPYIKARLHRYEQMDRLAQDELLSLTVDFVRALEWNAMERYWAWRHGDPSLSQMHFTSRSLLDPPVLRFMARAWSQHWEWMPRIERELAQGRTLLVVGEDHVSQFLLRMLQNRDYRVSFVGGGDCEHLLR